MNKKIREVSSDEDGENYFVIGDVTELGALRAIRSYMKNECGLDEDEEIMPKLGDLERVNFVQTDMDKYKGGEYEDWSWWGKVPAGVPTKPAGWGWIYKIT